MWLYFFRTFKQNNTVQLLHPPDFFVSFLGELRGSPGGHLVRLGIRWLRSWLQDGDFRQGPRPRGSVRCWLGDLDRGISRGCWEPWNRGLFSKGLEGRGCSPLFGTSGPSISRGCLEDRDRDASPWLLERYPDICRLARHWCLRTFARHRDGRTR